MTHSIAEFNTINWLDTSPFDSEDDYRTGCRNVSHYQRTTFTPTIILNLLMKWLLSSNILQQFIVLLIFQHDVWPLSLDTHLNGSEVQISFFLSINLPLSLIFSLLLHSLSHSGRSCSLTLLSLLGREPAPLSPSNLVSGGGSWNSHYDLPYIG